MFKSFQTRLVLFFVALFAVVQAATFAFVQSGIIQNIFDQAKDQLVAAGGILDRRITVTTEALAQGTAILAADFGFRQAVATGDHPTIMSALNNLATRIKADRIILFSVDNFIVADTGSAADAGARGDIVTLGEAHAQFPFANMTEAAEADGRSSAIVVLDGRIYQLVVVPILAPVPIAWIAIGLEIGNSFAEEMRRESTVPVEVSFAFADQNGEWLPTATTLTEPLRALLARAIKARPPLRGPQTLVMDRSNYVTVMAPIPGPQQGTKVDAILQYSLEMALQPYRTLFWKLFGVAVAAVALSLAGATLIARSITKPIRRLDAAAQRIQMGRYTEKVPVVQNDEIGRLSQTFNQMMEGIAEREEKIAYQARHDIVTGIPNRMAFEAHLSALIAEREEAVSARFSVLLLQIGRFAEINNTFGHDIGDQMMCKVSESLKQTVVPGSFIARHANNMFAISIMTDDDAVEIAAVERILANFGQSLEIGGLTMDVTTCIGIARYPNHGATARTLLQHADSAVYVAKKASRPYAIYDAELDPHKPERLSMMGELRTGLEKGQFRFYFQPKIDLASGKVTAAEALIRWIHPERGLMGPDLFIPLAEQTGNIARVTAWALEAAVRQSRIWTDKGIDIRIAVNLSARDLANRQMPDDIAVLLDRYGVRPDRIILEITESAVMEEPINALGVLKALNGMGLTLSVDDYGTGYSSLAYLKSLPVQEIKIDKSFVLNLASNPGDEILVRSTIDLGHNLGLKVTAEGIEDPQSMAILDAYGCETGQGYFISKPLPAAEFETFYATSRWSPVRNARTEMHLPGAAAVGE